MPTLFVFISFPNKIYVIVYFWFLLIFFQCNVYNIRESPRRNAYVYYVYCTLSKRNQSNKNNIDKRTDMHAHNERTMDGPTTDTRQKFL